MAVGSLVKTAGKAAVSAVPDILGMLSKTARRGLDTAVELGLEGADKVPFMLKNGDFDGITKLSNDGLNTLHNQQAVKNITDIGQPEVKVNTQQFKLKQGDAPEAPQFIWASGKGSKKPNQELRENLGGWLQTKFSETDETLDFDVRKKAINRSDFGNVVSTDGVRMELQGVGQYLKSVQDGKPNPSKLQFIKVSTRHRGNLARLERMRAPEEELYAYATENNIPDADVAAYLKEYSRSFNQVKKASSLNTKMGAPSDAGHWISTMSSTGPDVLDQAPTSGRAARIEDRFKNRSGGAKSSHDMNPYAAEIVGIPRNWKEDFILFLDQRPGGPNTMPNWMSDFQSKDLDALLAIPTNASKAEVESVFDDLVKGWRKDRNHWSNQIKSILREGRLNKLRGTDAEIDAKNEELSKWLREELAKEKGG